MSNTPPSSPAATPTKADSVVRTMTGDDSFRVITVDSTETVRGVIAAQGLERAEGTILGELVTGTVLFRETMSPELRVQGIIKCGNGGGQFIADSHRDGSTRGLVQRVAEPGTLHLSEGSTLRMMRSLPDGRINQGVVEIPGRRTVCEGIMAYMQLSEQIVTMVAVGVRYNDHDDLVRAGGYVVQLLPGAARGPLMVMTERLRDFEDLAPLLASPEFSADHLQAELLYAMDYTRLEERPVRYHCWCDEQRVLSALATLKPDDLRDLLKDGEAVEVACEYCHTPYRIASSTLRGLLAPN